MRLPPVSRVDRQPQAALELRQQAQVPLLGGRVHADLGQVNDSGAGALLARRRAVRIIRLDLPIWRGVST